MTQAAKTHRDLGSRASSARCQTLRVHNVPTPWTSVDLPSSHRGRGMAHRFGLEPCRWALRPLSAAQRLAAKAPRMVADATGRRGLRGLQAILRRGVRWKRRARGRGEARCTGEARHPYPSLSPSPAARRASPRLLESRGGRRRAAALARIWTRFESTLFGSKTHLAKFAGEARREKRKPVTVFSLQAAFSRCVFDETAST